MYWQSLNCTLTLEQPAPHVAVLVLTGRDVGELGDAPFRSLEDLLAQDGAVELYIDAREASAASIDVSGAWARWLGAHKSSFVHVSMLTGSRFIQLSAGVVKRFAEMGDTMRLYTDSKAFEEALATSVRSQSAAGSRTGSGL